jgi:chorismate dehydratase
MVRVGFIEYLNCLPLRMGLEATGGLDGVELVSGPPARINAALNSGELELGLVSSLSWAENRRRLQVVPGYGITSHGPVMSVLLAANGHLESARRVALTSESATSQGLAKVLLERVYGGRPEFEEVSVGPRAALAEYDAALFIGDSALRARKIEGIQVHDLGELWTRYSGLPMVYAVWVSRRDPAEFGWFADRVARAVSWSERNLEVVVEEALRRGAPATEDELREYYGRCIGYRVGTLQWKGLYSYLSEVRRLAPETLRKVIA